MKLMEEFVIAFNKIDDVLLKVLEKKMEKGPVDVLELTTFSTLDTTLGE